MSTLDLTKLELAELDTGSLCLAPPAFCERDHLRGPLEEAEGPRAAHLALHTAHVFVFSCAGSGIGKKFKDADVQKDMKNFPYKIVASTNGDAWVYSG